MGQDGITLKMILSRPMPRPTQSDNTFIPKSNSDHMHYRGKQSGNCKSGRRPGSGGGRGSLQQGGGREGPLQQRRGFIPWGSQQHWGYPPWSWFLHWASPPSPYPTQGWARGPAPTKQTGLLGPHPQQQQAFVASANEQSTSYAPTDIASTMHTMSLNPPDPSWYMDTDATSHMTSFNGRETNNEM